LGQVEFEDESAKWADVLATLHALRWPRCAPHQPQHELRMGGFLTTLAAATAGPEPDVTGIPPQRRVPAVNLSDEAATTLGVTPPFERYGQ
jgi:hypothetical protein